MRRWRGSGGGLADVGLGLRRCTAALGCSGEVPAQVLVRAEEGDAGELVGAPGGLGEQLVAQIENKAEARVWRGHGEAWKDVGRKERVWASWISI